MSEYEKLSKTIDVYLQKEEIEDTDEIISAYTIEKIFKERRLRAKKVEKDCRKLAMKINKGYTVKQRLERKINGINSLNKEIAKITTLPYGNKTYLYIEFIHPNKVRNEKYSKYKQEIHTHCKFIISKSFNETQLHIEYGCFNPDIISENYQEILRILTEEEILSKSLEPERLDPTKDKEFFPISRRIIYSDDTFCIEIDANLIYPKANELTLSRKILNIHNLKLTNEQKMDLKAKIEENYQEILKRMPIDLKKLQPQYQSIIKENLKKMKSKIKTLEKNI